MCAVIPNGNGFRIHQKKNSHLSRTEVRQDVKIVGLLGSQERIGRLVVMINITTE